MKFDSGTGNYSVKGKSLIPDHALRQIEVLTPLLSVLCNGVVRPNDVSYQIRKLEKLEAELNIDLMEVKNCCPQDSITREAKDFKPLIDVIYSRLTGLIK
jgi:hypothetical protein